MKSSLDPVVSILDSLEKVAHFFRAHRVKTSDVVGTYALMMYQIIVRTLYDFFQSDFFDPKSMRLWKDASRNSALIPCGRFPWRNGL